MSEFERVCECLQCRRCAARYIALPELGFLAMRPGIVAWPRLVTWLVSSLWSLGGLRLVEYVTCLKTIYNYACFRSGTPHERV